MRMAPSRRVGVVACVLFPLVFCLSSVLPRTDVFSTATAPACALPSSLLINETARYFFHFAAASAAPTAASPDGAATEQSRAQRLLKYAEQRAENAEEELKRFRQTHESSVRACSEASQRKQRELESCQEQNESFRKMYNNLQAAKSSLEKEVHSLQSQLAAANAAAASGGAPADRDATDDTEKLRAELKKLKERLQAMEEQRESEVRGLHSQIRELLIQRELLRRRTSGAGGGERHLASLSGIQAVLMDVARLYRVLGEQLLGLVPAHWWESAASMKMEAQVLVSPYVRVVYEKVYVPLTPYVDHGKAFFFSHVYPVCETVGRRAAAAAQTISDDVMPAINSRLDAALKPIFAQHPDVEALVPTALGDRLAVFAFLLLLTYFVALFSFRYVLFPVGRTLLRCGRGSNKTKGGRGNASKSTRTDTASSSGSGTANVQQKRFIPSGAAVPGSAAENATSAYSTAQGGAGGKKGQLHHHHPTRPFPFPDKYENAPANMKKV